MRLPPYQSQAVLASTSTVRCTGLRGGFRGARLSSRGPLAEFRLKLCNEIAERFRRHGGLRKKFSTCVTDEARPVFQCVAMHWLTAQASGAAYGRNQVSFSASVQLHGSFVVVATLHLISRDEAEAGSMSL